MEPGSLTVARARSFAWWALMRLFPYPRLGAQRWLSALDPVLRRGALSVRGGLATRVWLDAAHFDPTSAQAYGFLTGTHEPMVAEALRRTLGPGRVFWDVGANIGFSALIAARLVGPAGAVVALDPQRECADAIRANAALNGFGQLQVVQAAAGAATGTADLIVVADSLWTRLATVGEHDLEARREHVAVVALDDLEAPPPDVVKIDVEGAELDVLAGAQRLLSERRPILIVEMHGKNAAFADAMAALDYRVTNLDGPEPVATADGNIHALCEPMSQTLAKQRE
jgi:FkbM family methyltransferase